jgi:hypothetical protein
MIIPAVTGVTERVTKVLSKKFESYTRKTLNRSTTKDDYTWNITYNTAGNAG